MCSFYTPCESVTHRAARGQGPLSPPARKIPTMTTAEANTAIRCFMAARAGRPLWPEEQVEYERLLEAWAAAVRAELVTAA